MLEAVRGAPALEAPANRSSVPALAATSERALPPPGSLIAIGAGAKTALATVVDGGLMLTAERWLIDDARVVRAAYRNAVRPSLLEIYLGLRLARGL